jgi:acyl-CoA synthetase (AMP-forming)/AMP-acid ligase II
MGRSVLGLREAMAHHAAAGRIALVLPESGQQIGYDELLGSITAYAAGARDLAKGQFVGILAPRAPEAIAAFFGLMEAGLCPCFMEPKVAPEATAERMASVGMTLLYDGEEALAALKRPGAGADYQAQPDDAAMMLFTSGSTGRPKGVVLSHANLACNARGVLAMTGATPHDRLLHVMPLHHTNGVNNQLIVPFLAGATVVLAERFEADKIPALIAEHGITYMTGVPTLYSRLLPHLAGRAPFPSLRFLRCGSAPITPELHREIEAAFGVELLVSYGLSEATCTSTMNPPGQRRIGSVGKVLDGQQVKLLAPGTIDEVGKGEEGEICIGGPSLMRGYVGDGAEQPFDRGWLRSGDLGRFDEAGFLSITGRIKDVIIRGGENLSPALVEGVLTAHDAVQAACVVGGPDADLGEVPVAFVVLRPGMEVNGAALQAHVTERLKRIYAPAAVHFVAALPENGVGKIDRKALRLRLRESV